MKFRESISPRAIERILACGVLLLGSCGCASRSYRLLGERANALLVPPGVKDAASSSRTFTIRTPNEQADCGLEESGLAIVRRGRAIKISVDRATLTASSPGWLDRWSDLLRERGCIPEEQRRSLVSRIAQSFPLRLRQTYSVPFGKIVRSEFMDFHPGQELRVVGPVFRDGSGSERSAVASGVSTQAGPDGALNVVVRSSPDLVGYEESWFAVRSEGDGGLRMERERTQFFHDGEVETLDAPQSTGFAFLSGARFMRMIYLIRVADSHDHDVLFVKAPTRRELETRSASLLEDPSRCSARAAEDWCEVGPRELSFNLFVTVEINGSSKQVAPGALLGRSLRDVIDGSVTGAERSLAVFRPYAGRLAEVDFDPSSSAILSLPLIGGEKIRWLGGSVKD